jgi:hypothetical protein
MANGELAGIAAQLYALPFDEFIAGRAAAAKEVLAGQTATPELRSRAAEVRALPKPSVSAWVVNMLARHRPEALRELAELGLAMRHAQDALDAPTLRSLAGERRKLLADTVGAARAVAQQQGRKISGAIAAEVEETLRAATADEPPAAAAPENRRGEPREARARPPRDQPRLRAVRQERPAPSPSARERAQAALVEAAECARSSAATEQRTAEDLQEATDEATLLTAEAARLKEELARAERGLRQARKRLDSATAAAQQAARAADKDRRREDLARERVLRLGNTPG